MYVDKSFIFFNLCMSTSVHCNPVTYLILSKLKYILRILQLYFLKYIYIYIYIYINKLLPREKLYKCPTKHTDIIVFIVKVIDIWGRTYKKNKNLTSEFR